MIDIEKFDDLVAKEIDKCSQKICMARRLIKNAPLLQEHYNNIALFQPKYDKAVCDLIRETNKLKEIFSKIGMEINFDVEQFLSAHKSKKEVTNETDNV
jgi:hypothetical protein